MYDILCDIWKNPGAAFSAMPVWIWNRMPEEDELIRQIDDFHKKGIDGLVIKVDKGIGEAYLTEEYFALIKSTLDAAKKRYMLIVFCDNVSYPNGAFADVVRGEKRLAARRLYPVAEGAEIDESEDRLFRVYARLEDELLIDVALDKKDGYVGYDLVLGYADGAGFDTFNPYFADCLISNVYEQYYTRFADYFGKTIIGFMNEGASAYINGSVAWTYGLEEEFFEDGGDFMSLMSLFFETKNKKIRREAENTHKKILRERLSRAYLQPLSHWCSEKGIGLFGYPDDIKNGEALENMHFPGQYLGNNAIDILLNASGSTAMKYASDFARHKGLSRSFAMLFDNCGTGESERVLTPDEMMRNINYAVSRGCSMIMPCSFYYSPVDEVSDVGAGSIWWKDYRKIAGYMKRMSWLGATGENNPSAAVLCSSDYVPSTPVKALYEQGYSFNYLTLDDFMERAHIHDGEIHIDRYKYKLLLIDGRLRLNAEIVLKIGKFITGGGVMFRGSDFIGAVKKHVNRKTYFEGECGGALRFVEYTKSGCPFFLLVNEGGTSIDGRLVTDKGCTAADFDPFTGKTSELSCEMIDDGFAYNITVAPHSAKVIGMNPSALPRICEPEVTALSEIVSLSPGRMTFDYNPEDGKCAKLSFTEIHDIADVSVNGQDAGRLIFMPYELDITEMLTHGENKVYVSVVGNNGEGSFKGCTVRMIKKK